MDHKPKIIDFARGIIKTNKLYFSDVFNEDGDAGGQYNYLNNCCLKKKRDFNFNFDLSRLGTTIINYIEDYKNDLLVGLFCEQLGVKINKI